MKVYELMESSTNEHIISTIASKLTTAIMDKINSESLGDIVMRGGNVGTISSLIGSKTTGPLYNRLGKVKIDLYAAKDGDMGYASKGQISINIYGGKKKTIKSVLVHELKHALEYSQTKDDAHDTMLTPGKGTNKPGDISKDQDFTTAYHRRGTEINARISQAMQATINAVDKLDGKDISNEKLAEIILSKLTKYQLQTVFKSNKDTIMTQVFGRPSPPHGMFHPTDNKQYRKIIGRVFKYVKEHLSKKDKK